jgi:uncharacterized membrane protein HdeD (DUF308 family)
LTSEFILAFVAGERYASTEGRSGRMATTTKMGVSWGRVAFGVLAIIFGILVFFYPQATLTMFLYLFGAFLLVAGIVMIAFGLRKETASRGLHIVEGGVEIIIAIVLFVAPGLSALTVVYIFAFFAIVAGILQLAGALMAPSGAPNKMFLGIAGVWSLFIGILLALYPQGGILAVLWIVALFAIVLGLLNIASGIRTGVAAPAVTPTKKA